MLNDPAYKRSGRSTRGGYSHTWTLRANQIFFCYQNYARVLPKLRYPVELVLRGADPRTPIADPTCFGQKRNFESMYHWPIRTSPFPGEATCVRVSTSPAQFTCLTSHRREKNRLD